MTFRDREKQRLAQRQLRRHELDTLLDLLREVPLPGQTVTMELRKF